MDTLRERLAAAMLGPPPVTQVDLARAAGVKQPSVNDWLSGKTQTIRGPALLAVARRLAVSPEWLASGKGPMRDRIMGGVSQNMKLDPNILTAAFRFLRNAVESQGLVYEPDADPDQLAIVYNYFAEIAEQQTSPNILDLGRKLAELRERRDAESRTGARRARSDAPP